MNFAKFLRTPFSQDSSGRLPLKIFKSLPCFFWSSRKRLHKKAKINFKVYDVVKLEENSYNHILRNISRGKDSQIMKFGQIIEYHFS